VADDNKHALKPPQSRNPALEQLDILAGGWTMEVSAMSFLDDPSAVATEKTSFEWLEDGKFLLQRTNPQRAEFPSSIAIFGPDDTASTYAMLYFDSRGVSRIYQMSLGGGMWKLWRDFAGFSQRFTGRFNADGNTIVASWEKSTDGSHWEHDFDVKYTRVKPVRGR